jgi:glycosyltransferase involved in cell wall biosynthesis
MKILFVTNSYPTKKVPDYGIFTKEQIEHIVHKLDDHEIIFINAKENGISEYVRAYRKIKSIYNEYDLIHCFHGLSLVTAFFASRKKPILISFLSSLKTESKTKFGIIDAFLLKFYHIILKSKRVYPLFKNNLPTDTFYSQKSFYLPNGVNLNKFYPVDKKVACEKIGIPSTNNYVLFVSSKGMNRREKRYDVFTRTIQKLQSKYPELFINELVMSNISRDMCIYYYNAASVHLLTSDFEGSPNSVKEAMSCNTPVVGTDVGNVKQLINDAHNCFVSEQDPDTLAKNVRKSIESPFCDLRDVLVRNGLTVEEKTKELYSIYHRILNKNPI